MSHSSPTTDDRYQESRALSDLGDRHIAGGVVSLNRKVEPPIVFVRAQGAHLWDADGNRYIDYHAAFAPHLLGHNDSEVNQAVRTAMAGEWSLMGTGVTQWELELAKMLCEAVPTLDCVQLTNSGSEASAHAIRLARAWTGRTDFILTLGGYNGWHNEVARSVMPSLEQVGPRLSPGEYPFIPLSAGIPASTTQHLHVVNFNDIESVEWVMKQFPIACVLTEPVLQNIGVVPPREGYLSALRKVCDRHGSLLVLDEVKTGFRTALAGYQSIAGVNPDLSIFGKAVANGYPMGVIGGRRDIMELFCAIEPQKRVLIAGTYNAHPFTSAAAIATLRRLQEGRVYSHLEGLAASLQEGMEKQFAEKGIVATVSRNGSAYCVYFCDHVPIDWHDILCHHDFELDKRYRRELIDRGVYQFPLPCKQGSISSAHSEEDIAITLEIHAEVLDTLMPG